MADLQASNNFVTAEQRQQFEVARAKGQAFAARLQNQAQYAESSPWTDPVAMEEWGWFMQVEHPDTSDQNKSEDLRKIIDGSNSFDAAFNPKIGGVREVLLAQQDEYEIEGEMYGPTDGRYSVSFVHGLIVARESLSPRYARCNPNNAMFSTEVPPLPSLQHWSDVVFLSYKKMFKKNNQSLQLHGVVQANVQNTEAKVMLHVLRERENRIKQHVRPGGGISCPYPGESFFPGSESYDALLGIPNGRSVAHLLLEHGHEFGRPFVKEIAIWWKSNDCATIWYKFGGATS